MQAFMAFNKEHWHILVLANFLAVKVDQAPKQRGGYLPDNAAVTRLAGAIQLKINDKWPVSRRHLSLKFMAPVLTTSPEPYAEHLNYEEVA